MKHFIINRSTASTLKEAVTLLLNEIRLIRTEASPHQMSENLNFWKILSEDPNVFPRALIIDGPSLITLMQDRRAKRLLLKFCQLCKVINILLLLNFVSMFPMKGRGML
jgi:hypothetical protein